LSLSAWPALGQIILDGWLLRFAGGYTKRANSVNPTFAGRLPAADKLSTCEAHYERLALPTIFRLASISPVPELDGLLAERGYGRLDKTSVRVAPLGQASTIADGAIEFDRIPSREWLETQCRWHGLDRERMARHQAILAAIPHPAAFVALREEGAIAALGVAVLQGEFACLNDISTDPRRRRRGLGRRLTAALMDWARRGGAEMAYLQVVKTNEPALALYGQLGFGRELYRYHYRVQPRPAG
jgi:GNAT superfamily N-acetyltransferase